MSTVESSETSRPARRPAGRPLRAGLGAGLRLSFAAAATTWVALFTWAGFSEGPSRFLAVLVVVGGILALTGALGRWRQVPGPLVLLGQLVVVSMLVCLVVGGRPYPDAAFWTALDDAFAAARFYAAPVPDTDEMTVQPLLVVGGALALVLVDLLACTLRRVPLAGLPLLGVYSVPVGLLGSGVSWWVFALTAVGFLTMLFLQEQEQVGRWGRSLDAASPSSRRSETVRGSALAVGLVATAAAVVAPLAIPTLSLEVFDFGAGPGGDDTITVDNPMTDLRRDLRRGDDVPLVEVVTDDPSPDHLRISVLNRFSENEFSSGDRDVPSTNLPEGQLPALQGVSGAVAAGETTYSYDVRIDPAFESRWLPTQAPITSIEAAGDWRYDLSTMDFLASQDDLTTAGLDYEMTAVEYDFQPEDLRAAPLPQDEVNPETLELPAALPVAVDELARSVTAGLPTPYDQAVALQQWFREDGGFTYSLRDAPSGEVGTDELEAFLTEGTGRVGYCEQFATAMAAMARVLDIPSRVAVGFLTPDRVGPDTYLYSAYDLHAWTELYFPGAGWVLFDPTPGARVPASELPAYTTRATVTDLPSAQPEEEPTQAPPERPSAEDPAAPAPTPEADDLAAADEDGAGLPWTRIALVLLVVALVALAVLGPRAVRVRQRERRLARGAESAWEELRATSVDLRAAWPEARSPREVQTILEQRLGRVGDTAQRPARGPDQAPAAAQALARIVATLERSRYSRDGSVSAPGALAADVETCRAALIAGAGPGAARRAEWLPRSVVERRPDVAGTDETTVRQPVTASASPPVAGSPDDRGPLTDRL